MNQKPGMFATRREVWRLWVSVVLGAICWLLIGLGVV